MRYQRWTELQDAHVAAVYLVRSRRLGSLSSSAFPVRPDNSAQSKVRDGEGAVAGARGADKIERIFAIIARPRPAGRLGKFVKKSFTSAARLPLNIIAPEA